MGEVPSFNEHDNKPDYKVVNEYVPQIARVSRELPDMPQPAGEPVYLLRESSDKTPPVEAGREPDMRRNVGSAATRRETGMPELGVDKARPMLQGDTLGDTFFSGIVITDNHKSGDLVESIIDKLKEAELRVVDGTVVENPDDSTGPARPVEHLEPQTGLHGVNRGEILHLQPLVENSTPSQIDINELAPPHTTVEGTYTITPDAGVDDVTEAFYADPRGVIGGRVIKGEYEVAGDKNDDYPANVPDQVQPLQPTDPR
jgi:hypothetical protein